MIVGFSAMVVAVFFEAPQPARTSTVTSDNLKVDEARTTQERRRESPAFGVQHRPKCGDHRGRSRKPAMPPSTANEVPVVAPASGPARYNTALATSCALTRRPDG